VFTLHRHALISLSSIWSLSLLVEDTDSDMIGIIRETQRLWCLFLYCKVIQLVLEFQNEQNYKSSHFLFNEIR
jgi:hypothetical protein